MLNATMVGTIGSEYLLNYLTSPISLFYANMINCVESVWLYGASITQIILTIFSIFDTMVS